MFTSQHRGTPFNWSSYIPPLTSFTYKNNKIHAVRSVLYPLRVVRCVTSKCQTEPPSNPHLINVLFKLFRYHYAIEAKRKLINNDLCTSVHVPSTTADTFLVHPWLYTRTPRGHLIHRPMAGWLQNALANQHFPLRSQDTCFLGNKGTGITNEIVFALPKLDDRIADTGTLCLPSFSSLSSIFMCYAIFDGIFAHDQVSIVHFIYILISFLVSVQKKLTLSAISLF